MLVVARLFLLTKADCDHVHHSFRFRHRERQPECHIEPGEFAAGRALGETLCLSSAASTRPACNFALSGLPPLQTSTATSSLTASVTITASGSLSASPSEVRGSARATSRGLAATFQPPLASLAPNACSEISADGQLHWQPYRICIRIIHWQLNSNALGLTHKHSKRGAFARRLVIAVSCIIERRHLTVCKP